MLFSVASSDAFIAEGGKPLSLWQILRFPSLGGGRLLLPMRRWCCTRVCSAITIIASSSSRQEPQKKREELSRLQEHHVWIGIAVSLGKNRRGILHRSNIDGNGSGRAFIVPLKIFGDPIYDV